MSERLSDDDLRDIASYEFEPSPEDVSAIASELVELRARLSAGPVMPEVPSDAQWSAIVIPIDQHIKPNGRIADVYADIRSALMQEQS